MIDNLALLIGPIIVFGAIAAIVAVLGFIIISDIMSQRNKL